MAESPSEVSPDAISYSSAIRACQRGQDVARCFKEQKYDDDDYCHWHPELYIWRHSFVAGHAGASRRRFVH